MLWPQAVTPVVTDGAAYHLPSDGNFFEQREDKTHWKSAQWSNASKTNFGLGQLPVFSGGRCDLPNGSQYPTQASRHDEKCSPNFSANSRIFGKRGCVSPFPTPPCPRIKPCSRERERRLAATQRSRPLVADPTIMASCFWRRWPPRSMFSNHHTPSKQWVMEAKWAPLKNSDLKFR